MTTFNLFIMTIVKDKRDFINPSVHLLEVGIARHLLVQCIHLAVVSLSTPGAPVISPVMYLIFRQ